MKALKDQKNETLALSECSADEVVIVLVGLSGLEPGVIELLHQILANQEKTKMFEDDVIAKLTSEKTVVDGVKSLLETLTGLVKANPGADPAKQAQILALIGGQSAELTDAIIANTPAAPPAPVVPPAPPAPATP